MIEKFQLVGDLLHDEGLVRADSGSLSVREGDKIVITRKGAILWMLKDEDLMTVGMDPSEADAGASIELATHRAVYKGSGVQAIVAAIPPYAVALSMNEEKIMPQDAEGKYFVKSIPVVKVREAINSSEVARMLPPIFGGGYHGAVIRGYGSFCGGTDLMEAYKITSLLENSCKMIMIAKKPAPAPQPQMQKPRDNRRGPAIPPGIGVMDRQRYNRR
ncbi:MAG TPA: class II aldolase/adducin family protein [Candidatus Omnitrophota bacterium]|nr:class II aldolase/adducin family protein [Candidatus Omnitrophota bacterium]